MMLVPKKMKKRMLVEDCRTALFQKIPLENLIWIEGLKIVIAVLILTLTTKARHAGILLIEG